MAKYSLNQKIALGLGTAATIIVLVGGIIAAHKWIQNSNFHTAAEETLNIKKNLETGDHFIIRRTGDTVEVAGRYKNGAGNPCVKLKRISTNTTHPYCKKDSGYSLQSN